MKSKTNLLKELGWSDELIQHFMIEDCEYSDDKELELQTKVYESNSLTFTYNAPVSGQYVIQENGSHP